MQFPVKVGSQLAHEHDQVAQVLTAVALAADLPSATAKVMAATQRPFRAQCFADLTQAAARHTIPSWGLITTEDKAIPPALQRFEYQRANAKKTVSVAASHCAMVGHPDLLTQLIIDADRSTR